MKIVKGTRICRTCRGICHGKCWRSKSGKRRIYFDDERCLKDYVERKIGHRIEEADYVKYRNGFFEKVFVKEV